LVLAGLQERFQPLTTRLFPRRVLLVLEDEEILLMALQAKAAPPRGDVLRRVPLPRGACVQGLPTQKVAIGDLIGDLLVELGLNGAELVAVLPQAAATWRVVQWPFDEWPEDPEQALRQIDPDLGLSFPLGEAYINLTPLPLPARGGQPASLLVAAPKDLVQAWIDVFAIAGFDLLRLDAAPVCDLRALEPLLDTAAATELLALLDVRGPGAQLMLVRQGVPEYSRHLSGSEAQLAAELQRCLSWWRQRDPEARSVQVLLCGTGADLDALAAALPAAGNRSVEILDPLERGWLDLSGADTGPEADAGPPLLAQGASLVRLSGLAMAEVAA
jgi:Tfp pilus assembly PilM family ATPase